MMKFMLSGFKWSLLGAIFVISAFNTVNAQDTISRSTKLAQAPSGAVITANDLDADMLRIPPAVRGSVRSKPASLQQMINNLMVRRILASVAERDGLASDLTTAAAMSIAREKVLSDAYLAQLDIKNEPNTEAIEKYAFNQYQLSTTKYIVPAQTRAKHILLSDTPDSLSKANELLVQLRSGAASFEELAKTHSIDSGSATRGGDLGMFQEGRMVKPFEDAVNRLEKPGDISAPIKSQFGYHIIRLEERQAERRQSFEEVKSQLIQEAKAAILNQMRLDKIQELTKGISIDDAAIEAIVRQAGN